MLENPALLIRKFIRELNRYSLSRQQMKTLKGQALAGDLAGAMKSLDRLRKAKV